MLRNGKKRNAARKSKFISNTKVSIHLTNKIENFSLTNNRSKLI